MIEVPSDAIKKEFDSHVKKSESTEAEVIKRLGFSSRDEVAVIDTECRNAGIGCVDCKKILAKNMETEMAPIQEKYDDLAKRPDDVKDALAKGAQRVKALSQSTMTEVRENLGLR